MPPPAHYPHLLVAHETTCGQSPVKTVQRDLGRVKRVLPSARHFLLTCFNHLLLCVAGGWWTDGFQTPSHTSLRFFVLII